MTPPRPTGIGPIISGRAVDGKPVYYFDLVMPDGTTQRVTRTKSTHRGDGPAKRDAVWNRSKMIENNRPGMVVTHDAASFDALVAVLAALPAQYRQAA